jgi:enoyl-CoA hydratase
LAVMVTQRPRRALLADCAGRLDTIQSTSVTNLNKECDTAVNTVSTEEAGNSEPEVLVEQRDRILIITINRPKAKNAVNAAVARGLADAVDRLDEDQGLSVGILTGAGGSFCAGMDLKAFARGEVPVIEGRGMGFTERPPVKPLIAAVEGYALAGGTELALATDLIVASKDAAFGIPEVKRGLVAGGGGLLRLPERIPAAIAMELALTGENLTAERAHALGMVNVLAEPGGALEAAIALAEKITANGPLAVAATKQIIVESRGWSPETRFAEQNKLLMPVFSSNDAKEGAIAFAEKRPARWTGT